MEIGYLAIGSGQTAEAETIFSGIVAVRSESELPLIGLGVAQLSAGKAGDAVKTLGERALGMAPESDLVKSFFGFGTPSDGILRRMPNTSAGSHRLKYKPRRRHNGAEPA